MPIPENPQSRSEQYLNAIATGDNSGLPEFPQSRMEQYLEVIAQNGGGGGGGGVLVVHRSMLGTPLKLTLDKTWQEIFDAASTGAVLILDVEEAEVQTKLVTAVYVDSGVYYCEDSSEFAYSTDSADGYPAAT